MMRSQLWEDDGNSAPGRGISECKDPEEERNLESVSERGWWLEWTHTERGRRGGRTSPQNLQRKGDPVFLLKYSL